jgi:MFS superfamily sulfate permease-like transporter
MKVATMRRFYRLAPREFWLGMVTLAAAVPGVLVVRPDAPLFYANAQPLRDAVRTLVDAAAGPVRALILDLDGSDQFPTLELAVRWARDEASAVAPG